jgi:hypothetical protein
MTFDGKKVAHIGVELVPPFFFFVADDLDL